MDYIIVVVVVTLFGRVSANQDPFVKVHPSDVYVVDNHPATLNCKAEGSPPPIITWYKDGSPLSDEHPVTSQESNNRVQLDDGSLFFLRITKKVDFGSYHCNATNPQTNRSVASRSASLRPAVLRNDFREHPSNFEGIEGDDIFLTCKPPKGSPEPKVKWKKNGKELHTDESGRYFVSPTNGLRIVKGTTQDSALYSCVAFNIAGEKESQPAVVVVKSKSFSVSLSKLPRDITVSEGKDATFSCPTPENSQGTVSWRKSNGGIPENRSQLYGDSFKITSVRSSDEGVYICTVETGSDVKEFRATLTVHTVPTVYVIPKELIVSQGREVAVACHATGSPPPTIYWNYESSSTFVSPSSSDGRIRVTENGTLVIDSAELEDSGDYFCHAMSISGKSSARVKVVVKELEFRLPPVIVYGPQNQTLPVGDTATMLCQASGDPEPEIMWWKNNELLLPNEPLILTRENGILEINKLKKSDSGVYTCSASSASGETKFSAHLQVEHPRNTLVLFSKSPGISSFPGQPSAPTVSDINHSSVRLSWQPNMERGSSEVEGYVLDMFCMDCQQKTWNQIKVDSPNPSTIVSNLFPDSTYFFLVRSKNSHGLSAPSATSVPIKTRGYRRSNYQRDGVYEFLTNQQLVQPLSAEAISSTALRVDWGFLEDFKDFIEGFIVKYQDIDRSGVVKSVKCDHRVNSMLLEDLSEFTWYEVNVHPYFENIEGMSTPARVRTFEDFPREPPQHVQASWHGNDSLLIIWEHPSLSSRNGILKGYKVYVTNNDTKTTRTTQVDATVESLMMSNMARHRVYTVRVSAFNKVGESPFSREVHVGQYVHATEAVPLSTSVIYESWFILCIVVIVTVFLFLVTCVSAICMFRRSRQKKKCKAGNFTGVKIQECSDDLLKTDRKPCQGSSQFPLLPSHSADCQQRNNPCCYDNHPPSDFESKNGMHGRSESQGHTYQTLDGAPCSYPHTWNPSKHLMTLAGCGAVFDRQQFPSSNPLQSTSNFFPANDIPNPAAYMIRHPPSNCNSVAGVSDKNSEASEVRELYVSGGSSDGSGCLRQQTKFSSNVSSEASSVRSNVNDSGRPLLHCRSGHGNYHHDDGNSSHGSSDKSSQARTRLNNPVLVQPMSVGDSAHYDEVNERFPPCNVNAHQKMFKHCNTPVSMATDTDDESTTNPCLHSMDDFSTISSMKSEEYSHQPINMVQQNDKFLIPLNQQQLIQRELIPNESIHKQFKCSEHKFKRPQISTFAHEPHFNFLPHSPPSNMTSPSEGSINSFASTVKNTII